MSPLHQFIERNQGGNAARALSNARKGEHVSLASERTTTEVRAQRLIEAVATIPVPDSVLQRIVSRGDAEEILRHHPGYGIDEIVLSLWRLLVVFRRGWLDLSRHLDRFNALAQDMASEYCSGEAVINEIQEDVQKEVFCLSCAALSLVAISRRLGNSVTIPDYRTKVEESFKSNPEHNFVQELRNNLNHGWCPTADWRMSFSFGSQKTVGEFTLSCPELLQNGEFNKLAQKYILSCGDRINVRTLFSSYTKRVESLYAWLAPEIEKHLPLQVVDYRRCLQAWKRNCAICGWRVMLGQVAIPKKIEPYLYLHRYLTEEQLKEVMAMQHRSRAQVDRIIELVDEEGACNDEIRQRVYQLFNIKD